jgi:hypothetical protein
MRYKDARKYNRKKQTKEEERKLNKLTTCEEEGKNEIGGRSGIRYLCI